MRADARRNRQRLIDVAREFFQEHGLDASLDEIARQAGVGPGTLYRHFPSREDLLDAIMATWIQQVDERAADAITANLPARSRLMMWFQSYVELLTAHHGTAARVTSQIGRSTSPSKQIYLDAMERVLLAVGQDIRLSDERVSALDVCRLVGGVAAVVDAADLDRVDTARLLDLVIDAIAAPSAQGYGTTA